MRGAPPACAVAGPRVRMRSGSSFDEATFITSAGAGGARLSSPGRRPNALNISGSAASRPSWPGRGVPSAWPTQTTTVQLAL